MSEHIIESNSLEIMTEMDLNLVNKKIRIQAKPYGINVNEDWVVKTQTLRFDLNHLEFIANRPFSLGSLLKIYLEIPNYWDRKKNLVSYNRIDNPQGMKVLAKVVKSESLTKRGKKKMILTQNVNIDEVDQYILKTYLDELKWALLFLSLL